MNWSNVNDERNMNLVINLRYQLLHLLLLLPQQNETGHKVRRYQIQIVEKIRQQPSDIRKGILLFVCKCHDDAVSTTVCF